MRRLLFLLLIGLVLASVAAAARRPTVPERKAILRAMPAYWRTVPKTCVSLVVRVSNNGRYAKVTPRISTARACLPYQGNGYYLIKRVTASRWRKIFVGSDLPPCTLRVPPDLIRCVNAP